MTKKNESNDSWPTGTFIRKGQKIARYKIIGFIGSGGMGDVYLANDTELHRKVALKFHSQRAHLTPEQKKQFILEAQNAASLNHPNIVTIYEVGEYQDCPFIAMEYIEGRSLQELIDTETLPTKKIIDIIVKICKGLSEAHRGGLIHQDIKPGNIFVSISDQTKILDFGLAQIESGVKLATSTSQIGTVSYMSPEQAKGEKIDARSDIFSTGVILYRLLSGNLPFTADYEAAILYAVVYQDHAPINDLPMELQKIINKALEKNPEDRYQNIDEMLSDIANPYSEKQTSPSSKTTILQSIIPSIAILPFSDLSPQKDQEYFCEGMADEIINALTKIDSLRVVSRKSVIQFKKQNIDIRKIGQTLNVDTILEGNVRSEGKRLRITVQLVNVKDGYYLWSEKYDRDMTDLFVIQDEISRSIGDKLKLQLDGDNDKPLVKKYTENLEAYHLYLRGRYYWNKRYEGGLQRSVEYFQQAIEKDPAYALPYTGLADAYNIMGFYNFLSPHESCPRAKAAASKAIEIDPNLAEAYTALGWVNTFYDWNWTEAETNFKHAIELNPNYATAHHYYSLFLMSQNRMDEGLLEIQHAFELDPLSMIIGASLGAVYYFARDFDEAVKKFHKALELDSNFALTHAYFAAPYICQKKFDKAIVECQKAGSLSGGSTYATAFLGYTYSMSGKKQKANDILEMLLNKSENEYVSAHHISIIYIGLDDRDNAFKWLDKACQQRDNWIAWLSISPVFDNLRSDPRFDELLSKVGLNK
ncbi:MAG: protein kinase [candidate division Zixibacteria bacterium]|nr:protein kinase [candidate division Zixibacteria bacterium]